MSSRRRQHPQMDSHRFFDEHIAFLKAAGKAETTIAKAKELLYRADRELPRGLCRALHGELVDWFASYDWKPSTRAVYRAHLVRFGRWAAHGPNPCLEWDPTEGLARARVPAGMPRPASDEQVAIGCTRARSPFRLHCLLAAYGGLRCVEIARLERGDVTAAEMLVHGKGGRDRLIPTHPHIWAAVRDLPAGPVTWKRFGGPPTAQWVSAGTWEHLHLALGLDTSLHRFRSWYATRILDHCGDLLVVKELLGHASVATTQVYTRVNVARLREAAAGLPPLDPPAASPADGDQP